jgi:hypothetical protein
MRSGGAKARIAPVAQERIHLDLRLDLGSEPVSGELVPPGGHPTPFSGYAGLIAALDRISEPGAAEATAHPEGEGGRAK